MEKYLRNYPNIKVGDDVKVFVTGKGTYTSRKDSRSQWTEKICQVKEVNKDTVDSDIYVGSTTDTLKSRFWKHRHEQRHSRSGSKVLVFRLNL